MDNDLNMAELVNKIPVRKSKCCRKLTMYPMCVFVYVCV